MQLIAITGLSDRACRLFGYGATCAIGLALATGCAAPISRPAGVPETPYWYVAADSTFWYAPEESLAVVQFVQSTGPDVVEQKLYELRRLGWRMTPARGPALQHAGQDQQLSQYVFQVERTDGATSPTTDRRIFALHFWSRRDADREPLKGILPGLQLYGQPPTRYYYPSCLTITLRDSLTASEAEAWLTQAGYEVLSSRQLAYQYFVQRTWVVELPAGSELFASLRTFNSDPRVETAFPVSTLRDPPAPDLRNPGFNMLGRSKPGATSAQPPKWSLPLWHAYRIARFAGYGSVASEATAVPIKGDLFHVLVSFDRSAGAADTALVKHLGGEILSVDASRVDAWIPFRELPDLAENPAVLRLDEARR